MVGFPKYSHIYENGIHMLNKMTLKNDKTMAIFLRRHSYKIWKESFSDVRYLSKYHNTPGVLGYDTAMLVYQ